jgi:hypothetical protein
MPSWILLQSKLPAEPSARRVYIWRKLKRLGAIYHQDSVWVLPDTARTREQFQWLSVEIIELGGEATFWEAQLALPGKDDVLIGQFQQQVDQTYSEILDKLRQPDPDLDELSRQYQQIRNKDYFQSELGHQLQRALLAKRGVEL